MVLFQSINRWLRIISGVAGVLTISSIMCITCFPLLPFRALRVRLANYEGRFFSYLVSIALRAKVSSSHRKHLQKKLPAIFISNHTSALDIFIFGQLIPPSTMTIAKREITWIPIFGWSYAFSGHLPINRSNKQKSILAMQWLVHFVHKHGMGIWIWPEGTRSKDGRLKKFKKGFAHLAMDTGYPIVPVIIHDANQKWPRHGKIDMAPTEIKIEILDSVDTSDWTRENLEKHIQEIWQLFSDRLGERQKPLS